MGNKEDHINNLMYLFGIVILSRLIFPLSFYFFNFSYWFLNLKTPYYISADSWYYAKILDDYLPNKLIFYGGVLIFYTGLIFFYYACNEYTKTKNSLLCTILLSFSPIIYTETLFGYVDTAILLHTIMCIVIWCFTKYYKGKKEFAGYGLLVLSLLVTLWGGWFFLWGVFFILYITKEYRYKWLKYVIITAGLLILIPIINRLWYLKELGVSEYGYLLYPICWLIILYVLFYGYKNDNTDFMMAVIILIIPSILFQRVFGFIVPFLILRLAIQKNDFLGMRWAFLIFALLNVINTAIVIVPEINQQEQIELINIEQDKIYSSWGNGHLINYFTNDKALFKAEPTSNFTNYTLEKGVYNFSVSQKVYWSLI